MEFSCIQILGDIVADRFSELSLEISIDESNENCRIAGTSSIYDADAENIFGIGYVSLQVHVAQRVNITSGHFLWLEEITSIVESGFEIQTGGQSEFRQRLQQNSFFSSVLIIELRRGLQEPQGPPSPAPNETQTRLPTRSPTFPPTRAPTRTPSPKPSRPPTRSPSISPTKAPSLEPTPWPSRSPTNEPSEAPSETPTVSPSHSPSEIPSISPTFLPSTEPSNFPTRKPSKETVIGSSPINPSDLGNSVNPFEATTDTTGGGGSQRDSNIIAAGIAGGVVTLCVSCILMTCFLWRKRREKQPRRKPAFALTSRDGQQKHDPENIIPDIVELDQQSLADTTLGEQTAGRRVHRVQKKRPPPAVPHLGSFDEQSLYTTPFSVKPDESSSYFHATSPVASAFSNAIVRPFDYERNNLLPVSDTNTESSDGIYSSGQASDRGQQSLSEGPIDLDTQKAFDLEDWKNNGPVDLDTETSYELGERKRASTPTNNESLARKVSKDLEEGDTGLDPYEIDTWSCDFQDFDRGSDFYAAEELSRSASQSSQSPTRLHNITSVLGRPTDPYENSQISGWDSGEEKKDIEDELVEEKESFAKLRFNNIQHGQAGHHGSLTKEEVDQNAVVLYNRLMTDRQKLEKSVSPPSLQTKKSASSSVKESNHSRKSSQSFSSVDSRKTYQGQNPLYSSMDSRLGPLKNETNRDEEKDSPLFPVTLSSLFNAVVSPDSKDKIPHPRESALSKPEKNEDASYMPDRDGADMGDEGSESLLGIKIKDDNSASSVSTGMSPNPWLYDVVEQTLGPRSVTADMESLSGKSNLIGSESVISQGSRVSYRSSRAKSDVSQGTKREVQHNLKRLELQLAALDKEASGSLCASSITGGASLSTVSTRNRSARVSRKKRMIVVVPPGKLGVILANRHDGKGTVVSELRDTSALRGLLSKGDKLVAVDGEDVTGMEVSQITSLMASRAERERRLTVITKVPQQHSKASESKKSKIS